MKKFRKGAKNTLTQLQVIVLKGDLKNLCRLYKTKTILHTKK